MSAAALAERVARESYGRLLALLSARTRDVLERLARMPDRPKAPDALVKLQEMWAASPSTFPV